MRLERIRAVLGETCIDATVQEGFAGYVEPLIADARAGISDRISRDPFFGMTYSPCRPLPGDSVPVRRMCAASVSAGVGPMAAVAGAVASHVLEGLRGLGCTHAVIDNGGDVAVLPGRPVVVRILPDPGSEPAGLLVEPGEAVGICSSSGMNGHSVSLGGSDVCTVVSPDPVLADACATLLGNLVSSRDDLSGAVEEVAAVDGVSGCIACIGGETAVCGDIPELVPLRVQDRYPTRHLG